MASNKTTTTRDGRITLLLIFGLVLIFCIHIDRCAIGIFSKTKILTSVDGVHLTIAEKRNATTSGIYRIEDEATISLTFQNIPINKASVALLQTIPGVGEKLAHRIVNYRTENGPFTHQKTLQKVDGIGRVKSHNLSKHISFQ